MDKALLSCLKKLRGKNKNQYVLDQFEAMYRQYVQGNDGKIALKTLEPLHHDDIIPYVMLDDEQAKLDDVAIIKLNGGLGTGMGCTGPKSLIEVKNGQKFIDIIINQIKYIRKANNIKLPLYFMNSPSTHEETLNYIKNEDHVKCFLQSEFPRIDVEEKGPFECEQDRKQEWSPAGHGDIYGTMFISGVLDELIEMGIKTVFISNSDNLGANIDPKILNYMQKNNIDFLMETTPKTKADVKGGTLVRKKGQLTLLERAQVEEKDLTVFEDIQKFQIFNTNNLWINLEKLKEKILLKKLNLPLIVNKKVIKDTEVIQLESAMGAAIGLFESAKSVVVDRSRFLPVKKNSDLLIIRSDVIDQDESQTYISAQRNPKALPQVSLSEEYDSVEQFDELIQVTPSLIDCQTLTIEGPFYMLEPIKFTGHVELINTSNDPVVLDKKEYKNTTEKFG